VVYCSMMCVRVLIKWVRVLLTVFLSGSRLHLYCILQW
jgi:hypothetical protein